MYLEQALDMVGFEELDNEQLTFAYSAKRDAIVYNPNNTVFERVRVVPVLTHELSHRIDAMFVRASDDATFMAAVQEARSVIGGSEDIFTSYVDMNDDDGFLSDILSALCEDDVQFWAYHEKEYWRKPGKKEKEIFANLFSLESFGDKEKYMFLHEYFPDVLRAYDKIKP